MSNTNSLRPDGEVPPDPADDVIRLPGATAQSGGGDNHDEPPHAAAEDREPEDAAEGGGGGSHDQPPHAAAEDDEPEDTGDGQGDGGDDDDVDIEWDDLDDTAGQDKEDFRRKTEMWPEPVDANELFIELVSTFHRFLVLPDGAAEVLALWVIHTYALHYCGLRFSPRLMITAPGPNSGKTTLLDILAYLVRFPDPVSIITPAGFFRSLNARKSVLIDECDHNLPSRTGAKNELVQMLNAGHKRTSAVKILTETIKTQTGTQRINRRYSLYSSVAMAGIGSFAPPTVQSRSFKVKLLRKMPQEQVDEFVAEEHAPQMRELRSKIIRFVKDTRDAIRYCRPVLDRELMNNRQRDNAIILLQIADPIGPECGREARDAIKRLTSDEVRDPAEMLLGDVAYLLNDPTVTVNYASKDDPPRMLRIGHGNVVFSSDLVNKVVEYFDYREQYSGFTPSKLASLLSQFDIYPEDTPRRRGGKDNPTRWYRRDRFEPMFIRYGFVEPDAEVTLDDLPASYAEGATPLDDEEVGSDVAGQGDNQARPTGQTPLAAPPEKEASPKGATSLHDSIVYANAVEIASPKGDQKRASGLRRAVDAAVAMGQIDPAAVRVITSRFWLLTRDAATCFAHLDGDRLEWEVLDPAVFQARDGVVYLRDDRNLSLTDTDFLVMRPLVNKARKALA